VELEVPAALRWDRSPDDVALLVGAGDALEAGDCGSARALKRVTVEVVNARASVVPARVVIRLDIVGLVLVVDAVVRKLQLVAPISVEFKSVEISEGGTEGVLAIQVLDSSRGLR